MKDEWKWQRVTKKDSCPICGHPDWCTVCVAHGLALCMREPSQRPSKNAMGGWIWPIDGSAVKYVPRHVEPERPAIDARKMMREFEPDTTFQKLQCLALSLHVSVDSLRVLGCQRAERYRAWAFPMFNGSGQMAGIRLRGDNGDKFAVTGSRSGIFLPQTQPAKTAWIVEGASDTAALLTLGLWGFGRPQCSGCVSIITATIARLSIREVIIIADSDNPGVNGAESLSKELNVPHRLFVPPTKDLRDLLQAGLKKDDLRQYIKDTRYRTIKSSPSYANAKT